MPMRLRMAFVREKAERELGYTARPLIETIRDAYAWMLSEGMLEAYTTSARTLLDHSVTPT